MAVSGRDLSVKECVLWIPARPPADGYQKAKEEEGELTLRVFIW